MSTVQDRVFAPILILVMTVLSHPWAAFEELNGFDPAGEVGAPRVLADAFESEDILARIGPKVEQMEFLVFRRVCVEVKRLADLYTVEKSLETASIQGSLRVDHKPQGLFRLYFDRKFKPRSGLPRRLIQENISLIKSTCIFQNFALAVPAGPHGSVGRAEVVAPREVDLDACHTAGTGRRDGGDQSGAVGLEELGRRRVDQVGLADHDVAAG